MLEAIQILQSQKDALEYFERTPSFNEIEFRNYQHEVWAEDPKSWSPLITLEQLAARPDLEVKYYCPDFIPVGAKILLSAEPKCGKTILLFHILNAVLNGKTFLGKPCTPTKVIYFTEQTEHEFKRQVKEVPGLIGNPNFYLLLAEEFPPELRTWKSILMFAEEKMRSIGAHILVFDTFIGMAKLPAAGENDSATIQNCIDETNFLFRNRYLSVVFVHHSRKRSEDPTARYMATGMQSARGSSAFVGAVGHILTFSCPNWKETTRKIEFWGRYKHGEEMSITLINQQYHLTSYPRA